MLPVGARRKKQRIEPRNILRELWRRFGKATGRISSSKAPRDRKAGRTQMMYGIPMRLKDNRPKRSRRPLPIRPQMIYSTRKTNSESRDRRCTEAVTER
jgi:hypothetical protein